jgi:hypothetical protein
VPGWARSPAAALIPAAEWAPIDVQARSYCIAWSLVCTGARTGALLGLGDQAGAWRWETTGTGWLRLSVPAALKATRD